MSGGSDKGKQTVGYKYYLGIDFAWCHAPIDKITNYFVGEKSVEANLPSGDGIMKVKKPKLHGKQEGGVAGKIQAWNGDSTQQPDPYLEAKLGEGLVPSYKGIFRTVLKGNASATTAGTLKSPGRAFYVGNNPYLKKHEIEVQRIYKRIQDGAIVDQWQKDIAGVPLLDPEDAYANGNLPSLTFPAQTIFITIDLSSAANGYEAIGPFGEQKDITGAGQDINAVKAQVVEFLEYLRDTQDFDGIDFSDIGSLIDGTGQLNVGVGFFRYTDYTLASGESYEDLDNNPNALDPDDINLHSVGDVNYQGYDPELPDRGFKFVRAATPEQLDLLIDYVEDFVVVPDTITTGRDIGLITDNLTQAMNILGTSNEMRTHIIYSAFVTDIDPGGADAGTIADEHDSALANSVGTYVNLTRYPTGTSGDELQWAEIFAAPEIDSVTIV